MVVHGGATIADWVAGSVVETATREVFRMSRLVVEKQKVEMG